AFLDPLLKLAGLRREVFVGKRRHLVAQRVDLVDDRLEALEFFLVRVANKAAQETKLGHEVSVTQAVIGRGKGSHCAPGAVSGVRWSMLTKVPGSQGGGTPRRIRSATWQVRPTAVSGPWMAASKATTFV